MRFARPGWCLAVVAVALAGAAPAPAHDLPAAVAGPASPATPAPAASAGHWERRAPTGRARQEVSYVALDGRLYLAGGARRHQVYNPRTNRWRSIAPLPRRLDHIQAV